MTHEQFLAWDAPGPERWQLVDGEPVAMAPASRPHAAILSELARLVGNHLVDQGSACHGLVAPGVVPHRNAGSNHRIPDFGITCSPPAGGSILEHPVLLAEILSPSNETQTRVNIPAYATIPGLQEILLLRSTRIEAELLRRGPDGAWAADATAIGPGDALHLAAIGFTAPLASFYRTAGLPDEGAS